MRKYLDELDSEGTWNMTNPTDERNALWEKQQEEYGFDERDTWNLDHTMLELLYERIKMFIEVSETMNHDLNKVTVDGEELPFPEVVDNLLELCETVIRNNNTFEIDFDEQAEIEKKIWSIWAQTFQSFWW